MVNVSESVIKIVIRNKRKWLLRLNQNGMREGWNKFTLRFTQTVISSVKSRHLTQHHLIYGTRKSCIALEIKMMNEKKIFFFSSNFFSRKLIVRLTDSDASLGCWKKQMLISNRWDTNCNIIRRESVQTSSGSFFVKEFVESIKRGLWQMTVVSMTGAASARFKTETWKTINWDKAEKQVRRL